MDKTEKSGGAVQPRSLQGLFSRGPNAQSSCVLQGPGVGAEMGHGRESGMLLRLFWTQGPRLSVPPPCTRGSLFSPNLSFLNFKLG